MANTGAYEQYIRVIVTVSDAAAWKAVFNKNVVALTDLVTGYESTMWDPVGTNEITADDTFQYVLYYTGKLAAGTDIKVFEQVAIPDDLTQDQAAAFGADGFDIVVKAQAVQTENVGTSAYEAFQTVGMGL